ncbi:IPT/TIG domain-containing protein [Sphingobacterium gobiense]|uniref:IPT/TIG domain-containing protein n=1 Tax=Sphingobacterium gobiense TaxID=1382456 RepID=A0A2S9JV09_9SPHI|nr:IPT/TIG domain-containing protein [Sphingobacterium gobiense]PRD57098.1 hypothetical protein C5749_07795 [Sphingobacterium gobiense]
MKTARYYRTWWLVCVMVAITLSCSDEEQIPLNTAPIPRITELSPANASVGDEITIVGVNFSGNPGENEVKFNQTIVDIIEVSETAIKVIVPELTGNVAGVSVRSRGKISNKRNLSLVRVKTFEDNFNRADVPPVGSDVTPNPIGSNWQIVAGTFEVKNNRLFCGAASTESYALYRDPELRLDVGEGSYFRLEADMQVSPESFAGIIFNAQSDNKRFYLFRTSNGLVQMLKSGSNGLNDWANVMMSENIPGFAPHIPYRIAVSSSQPGRFVVKVMELNTNTVLFERSFEDANPYVGGSPGVYYFGLANPIDIAFDNLHIETM